MLPGDWRERLVAMIRGAEPLRDEWFTGGPVCTPMQQIGIYANQYRLRLWDALMVEVPGLQHLVGDDPEGEAVLRRYIAECPSRSWTLNRVADRLGPWLAEQPGVPRSWVEMAYLDRAVQAGFEAADGAPIEPERLVSMPPLKLQPHVSLLRLTCNVHEIRSAALTKTEPPPLRGGDFPIVVFRRDDLMRHWVIPVGMWGILDAIGRGAGVGAALEEVHLRGLATAQELAEHVGTWFRDMAERSLVTIADG